MRIISLYSGADNLGDGVIQAGFKIKLCVEMNKDCCETIKLNHPDIEVINDKVSNVLTTLPKADCIIGGPPCPEFSRAKSDRTFDLCEVNNFRKVIEITGATHHFMENVQDLYQVHKERNFLINCADYGVPQTRIRRIFTDLPLPKATHSEFPSQDLFGNEIKKWVSVREALGLDGELLDCKFGHSTRKSGINSTDKHHKTIDTQPRELFIEDRKTKYFGEAEYCRYSADKPHHTLITDSRDFLIISDIKNKTMLDKHPPSNPDKTSVTITTKDRGWNGDSILSDGKYARKLTNEELAILQGFRKDFKFYGNKTSVRRQIGNALPAAVSKAFFAIELLGGCRHL